MIQAFDYSHILREQYLPLCDKAVAYDDTKPEEQGSVLTKEEMVRVRQLDDFLEFFENLYYALSYRLVSVEDVLMFLKYYIVLLGNAYYDPNEQRLKSYVDKYYFNLVHLLNFVEKQLTSNSDYAINLNFENYPRRKKEKGVRNLLSIVVGRISFRLEIGVQNGPGAGGNRC